MNARLIYKPLEVSILVVVNESEPLGEYRKFWLSPGTPVQLDDHRALRVRDIEGLQYTGSISVVSFSEKSVKKLSFFVSKQAYDEAIVPPPEVSEKTE